MAIGTPTSVIAQEQTTSNATHSFTFSTGAAIGDTVTVGLFIGSTTAFTLSSVSDTRGHTWTTDLSPTQVTSVGSLLIVRTRVTTTIQVGDTVTVTISAAKSRWACRAYKTSGLHTSPLDVAVVTATGADSAPSVGPSATTTQPEAVAIAWFGSGVRTFTAGTNYTTLGSTATTGGTSDRQISAEYRQLSTMGAQTATAAFDTSSTFVGALTIYKGSSVSQTVTPTKVSAVAAVGSPSVSGGANAIPQAVAVAAAVPAPTVDVGGSTAGLFNRIQDWQTSNTGTTHPTSLASATLPSLPTAGNTLVMCVVSENTVTTPAGWTLANESIGQCAGYVFYRQDAPAAQSWAVTATAASAMTISVAEFEGIATLNTTSVSKGTSTTRFTGSATSSTPASFDIACFGTIGTSPTGHSNPTNSFTEDLDIRTTRTSGNNVAMAVDTRRDSVSGTVNSQVTSEGTGLLGGVTVLAVFALTLSNAQPRPTTVAAVAAVPAPFVAKHVQLDVATVAAVAAVPTPAIDRPGFTQVNAVTVAAVATVPSVTQQVITSVIIAPDPVAARVAVIVPTVIGDTVTVTVVQPSVVAAVAAVGTPTFSLGASVTVVAQAVAAVAAVPAPSPNLGIAVTATPSVVAAVAAVPSPVVGSNDVTVTPVTVAAVAAIASTGLIVVAQPIYVFRTPLRAEGGARFTVDATPNQKALWRYVAQDGPAIAVLVTGDTITERTVPTQDEIAAADHVFMGGYENYVEGDLADLLINAGYDLELIQ